MKWIILYGILTGFYWLLVVASNVLVVIFPGVLHRRFFEFDQPSVAFMDSLNPKYLGVIRFEGLAACIFHVLIVWGLAIPVLNYAIVYFGFGFSWSAMQYVHHFGTERHVLRGTRNLWLLAPIDLIWLHHNWHLCHHRHPTVPWIYLPELSAVGGWQQTRIPNLALFSNVARSSQDKSTCRKQVWWQDCRVTRTLVSRPFCENERSISVAI